MKSALVKEVKLTVPHELHIQPQMDADLLGVRTHLSPATWCHLALHVFPSSKLPVIVSHYASASPAPSMLQQHLLWPKKAQRFSTLSHQHSNYPVTSDVVHQV